MAMGYEFLDLSGDAGVRATGEDLREAFQEAALGMYALIAPPESVRPEREVRVAVEADTPEGLLVRFLNELVFLFDARGFIGSGVRIGRMDAQSLCATIAGQDFDEGEHGGGLLIKAATYHGLRISCERKGCVVEVMFDI